MHTVSLAMLTSYVKDEVLAGSTEDSNGKQLVMYIQFDVLGNLVSHFKVIAGTNEENSHDTKLVTKSLPEAVRKFNEL